MQNAKPENAFNSTNIQHIEMSERSHLLYLCFYDAYNAAHSSTNPAVGLYNNSI